MRLKTCGWFSKFESFGRSFSAGAVFYRGPRLSYLMLYETSWDPPREPDSENDPCGFRALFVLSPSPAGGSW